MSAPIVLRQETPGGVFKQLADAAGDGIEFWEYQPGGAMEQLRKLVDPELVLDQYAPGGVYQQIYDALPSGEDYVAQAVHFDGTAWLTAAAMACSDNGKFSIVFWNKYPAEQTSEKYLFVADPDNSFVNFAYSSFNDPELYWRFTLSSQDQNDALAMQGENEPDEWQCKIASFDVNFVSESRKGKIYNGDEDVTETTTDNGGAFTPAFNGRSFLFGTDGGSELAIGDFADIRIMPGVSLLDETGDIPLATRRLFIDENGKPVDPSVATAALGAAGAVLFSGDADTFATNQGTGGTFTLTGALTNATTSPSD